MNLMFFYVDILVSQKLFLNSSRYRLVTSAEWIWCSSSTTTKRLSKTWDADASRSQLAIVSSRSAGPLAAASERRTAWASYNRSWISKQTRGAAPCWQIIRMLRTLCENLCCWISSRSGEFRQNSEIISWILCLTVNVIVKPNFSEI